MEESFPNMVDDRVKELTKTQVPIYVPEGLIMERKHNQADVAKMIADAIQQERENLRAEITSQINNAITNHIPSQVDSSVRNYMSGHILHVHPTQASQAFLAPKIKFEGLTASNTPCRSSAIRPRDQDDPHDDAHPKGENSAKRQKTSEHGTYVFGESSSGQANESKQDDDELQAEKVSQKLMEEMSQIVDEAKLRKVNDIVWESKKEILTSPFPQKPTPVIQSCQRDPKAPALSLVKGNSRPEKFVLSLHKFLAINFPDDNIEERTSRWVNKCVKKFNPYARYSVEHWKNLHAKIFYIKRQKEPGKPKEEVYLNLKIVQVIKTIGESGHEHMFVPEIIARRANGSIVSITKPDYKNLNKNDIEDMYLLCINGKVDDYAETELLWSLSVFIRSTMIWERVYDFQLGVESYQPKVNLTAPTITFPGIEKKNMFSIINEQKYGIIYKNNKKEKKVMGHQEIHKFCDATLKRVLEGLKSYNNDVKHGYVTPSLSKEDVKYLQLFEEEIEE
ncbi:hypothetical protein Tco_1224461 [Tanacetum coccineum]